MTKLNRHYLALLIAYGLLGPLLPALALFLMNDSQLLRQEWPRWAEVLGVYYVAEVLGVYYVIGLAPALITGALVWALGLRRNRQGLNFTFAIALILAVVPALCLSRDWGDFFAGLLTSALTAGLLYRALPPPTADYRPVTKLQHHYCFLFLGFTVLGPLLPGILLALLDGDIKRLLGWGEVFFICFICYFFGLLPALLTGALVWQLKLRCDAKRGIATTLGLGFLMAALYGLAISGGELSGTAMGLFGIFAALFFCPFLPAPDKQP